MRRKNDLPRFKNTSSGQHTTYDGRVIDPGVSFRDEPTNIPVAFRDVIVPLDEINPEPEPEPANRLVKRHKGGGKYNIEDENTGKVLNADYLSKADAERIVADQDMGLVGTATDEYERGLHDEELDEQAEPQEEEPEDEE